MFRKRLERTSAMVAFRRALYRASEFDIQTAFVRLSEQAKVLLERLTGPTIVTLDIGTDSIRLLETSRNRVRRWTSGTLDEGLAEGATVARQQILGQRVKQLMASSGIKARKVVASINGLYSISRFANLPGNVGVRPMRQVVEELAGEIMPVALERIHLAWQQIDSQSDEPRVLIVGVPADAIDGEVRSLRAAGISPHLVELRAMALARLVDRETAIAINLDASTMDIVVTIDGAPETMRTVAWRTGTETAEDRAEQAAMAIEMTLGYFETYHPKTSLDDDTPVLVTGHLADNPALIEALETRLGNQVEMLQAPIDCPPFMSFAEYAVNIGLALKASASVSKRGGGGNRAAPDMNLLPGEYSPWRPSVRQLLYGAGIILMLGLLLPVYQLTTGALADTKAVQLRKATIEQQLANRQAILAERAPLQTAVNEYAKLVKMGGEFREDLEIIYDGAAELGVSVSAVDHGGTTVSVTCEAGSYETFRDYLDILAGSGRFATPIPPPPGYPQITGGVVKMEPSAP